jgi:hypothetical protein
LEVLGTGRRQGVNPNAAIGGRNGPFCFDQLFLEKALKSGVKGAFFDLQQVVGGPLNVLNEGIPMEGLELQRPENHHFQGAGEKVALLGFFHERGIGSRPSVRDSFRQGLEQNSVIEICSQEEFLSDGLSCNGMCAVERVLLKPELFRPAKYLTLWKLGMAMIGDKVDNNARAQVSLQ